MRENPGINISCNLQDSRDKGLCQGHFQKKKKSEEAKESTSVVKHLPKGLLETLASISRTIETK